jgi:predicted  nucleic acid-binding Zn-ribbon protein
MPDLEQRVTTLEQEMATLKARVTDHEEDTKSIPDLIKIEFRLANSQIARLSRDVAELQRGLGEVNGKADGLAAKVDALPRVLAEMLAERDKQR